MKDKKYIDVIYDTQKELEDTDSVADKLYLTGRLNGLIEAIRLLEEEKDDED